MAQVQKPKRERSCIACGCKATKGELVRIVRRSDGAVAFDATGKAAGRGAYVCSEACFEKAVRTKRLDRALRASLTEEDYERIASDMAGAIRGATG
ncbi:RNase P modulator RnpM [Raoultibacter phocaeensis]|uniref:RNase P modulator RnpM n=1 Tax=Raoultibacter phocaeensis TaxID=2479841 RepID=UPI00111B2899|nr:YlxR family protein [Raoultibacter phocaeensis]